MDNRNAETEKTYELVGRKRFGTLKRDIPTVVTVNDEAVHIKIKYKENQIETYDFRKKDVRSVTISEKFLVYTLDLAQLVIALLLMFINPWLLLVIPVYILFFMRCRHIEITLNSGRKVRFPVSKLWTKPGEEEGLLQELK